MRINVYTCDDKMHRVKDATKQGDSGAGVAGAAERMDVEQSESGSGCVVLTGVGTEKKGCMGGGEEEALFTNICPVCKKDVGTAEVVMLP